MTQMESDPRRSRTKEEEEEDGIDPRSSRTKEEEEKKEEEDGIRPQKK